MSARVRAVAAREYGVPGHWEVRHESSDSAESEAASVRLKGELPEGRRDRLVRESQVSLRTRGEVYRVLEFVPDA